MFLNGVEIIIKKLIGFDCGIFKKTNNRPPFPWVPVPDERINA